MRSSIVILYNITEICPPTTIHNFPKNLPLFPAPGHTILLPPPRPPISQHPVRRDNTGQPRGQGPAPPIRARIGPGLPPGPVPAARFRENAAIIRVPGGVFTSEKVRPHLAAFGRPISSSCGFWHVEIERRRFLGGTIRASGHTVRHTKFSDGDLFFGGGIFPQVGAEIAKKGA
jgi:hypothetical protein